MIPPRRHVRWTRGGREEEDSLRAAPEGWSPEAEELKAGSGGWRQEYYLFCRLAGGGQGGRSFTRVNQ